MEECNGNDNDDDDDVDENVGEFWDFTKGGCKIYFVNPLIPLLCVLKTVPQRPPPISHGKWFTHTNVYNRILNRTSASWIGGGGERCSKTSCKPLA